jgi:RNase P subunit RPR2
MAQPIKQDAVRANMKFQDAASHLLATTCPSVSAFLQQEFNEGAFRFKVDLHPTRKHQVCDSCGTISQFKDTEHDDNLVNTKCDKCGTIAKTPIEQSKRLITHSKLRLTSMNGPSSGKRQTRSKTQAQRKNQSSLHAMLAKSKAEASKPSFGLNLMDLMKS